MGVDIEETGFVMGVGIDQSEKEGEFLLTYQMLLPAAVYGEGGGSEGKKVWNISSDSTNIIHTQKQVLTRINRRANLEHAKVLIIGEDMAREGIRTVVDHYIRNVDIRRKTDVLITTGKAKEIFEIEPPGANSTSDYLSDIIKINQEYVHRISTEVDVLEMTKALRTETDFIIGKISPGEDEIEMAGAAVFKGDKLIGYISSEDIRKTKWITDNISKGTIVIRNVENLSGDILIGINKGTSKVIPKIQGEKVDFDVNIRVEGDIVEMDDFNFTGTTNREFILDLERRMEKEIEKECNEILEKAQKQFEADFLGLSTLVRQYDRRWFKQYEKQWREIFKESKLNLNVDASIRRIGLVK